MLSRFLRATTLVPALSASALLMTGCQRVPLLAPSGSTITLIAGATALPINATTQIMAQVIEPSGTPPHAGTQVTFTTNLGTIQPSNAETDVNGQAIATFNAGTSNGTATITAISGGVSASGSSAIKIAVGTAAVGRITLVASPTIIPPTGGVATITAGVFDINGNALSSAPVSFSTTAGVIDPVIATTDRNGVATTTLRTSNSATVTANVGATGGSTTAPAPGTGTGGGGTGGTTPTTPTTTGQATASVTVNVAGAPTLVITPPPTAPIAGLPSSYTFAVTAATTNGSVIRDLTVNWGDGTAAQGLGAVTGSAVVSHAYRAAGAYTITGTVTDASGFSSNTSTGVTVNPPAFGLIITPPTTPPNAGLPATFTINTGTLPAGDTVRNVHVDWGDGTTLDLGAVTGTVTVSHVYQTAGTFPVAATLTDTAGNSSSVATSVTVVATANPTIIITPTNVPTIHAATMNVTVQIQVTTPTGVGITNATIDWGDNGAGGTPGAGDTQTLGGLNGTTTLSHPYRSAGTFNITVTAVDTLGRTTTAITSITLP